MDTRIEHYYSLHPQEFPLVQEMLLSISGNLDIRSRSVSVAMIFRSRDPSIRRMLCITFDDVREMDFRPSSLPDLSVFLDIHLPEPRGWEADNRFVVVAEHFYDAFKFTCGSFEALVRDSEEK
jgi:hypothetical protein